MPITEGDVESGTAAAGAAAAQNASSPRSIHPPISRERGNSVSSPHAGSSAVVTGVPTSSVSSSTATQPHHHHPAHHGRTFSAHDTTPLLGRSISHGRGSLLDSDDAAVGGGGGGGGYLIPMPVDLVDDKNDDDNDERGRKRSPSKRSGGASSSEGKKGDFLSYLVYAIVNIIISVPGLYGYSSVIFNHPIFADYMNALPKLVIFSSCIHQLGFTLFSTLPFAIGTVQDAGLIFLSGMSNIIAEEILGGGGTAEEVVSTTLVILPLGTACLGVVLMLMGKFRLADVVAYLPMPVVGGYLAFIGYFCLEAGTALCISESMMELKDWAYLLDPHNLLLAVPGLVTGLLLTWISRNATSDATLPLTMIVIPAIFYVVIFATGTGIEGSREGGWVGEEMPPVPVTDLFRLIDFSLVHWRLVSKCVATWVGMVFVVSFASCLDVAAISMDMGEALDTNKELATVGACNFMSGCTIGFTGSYIFSQTIFTYRTGCRSKWVGIFIMIMFVSVVVSKVNFLSVLPLFFLGATLIFIGYDLLYEWLWEVREKLLLTEYLVLVATFVAIHIIGIDAGILFGVVIAVIDYVFTTAQVTTVTRVVKRSRAVWKPEDWKLLQDNAYGHVAKIVTFEIKGSVFFGSSIQLLQNISSDIGIDATNEETQELNLASPAPRGQSVRLAKTDRGMSFTSKAQPQIKRRPDYVVLDLSYLSNLDASAARGCFLQLTKMCAKRGIVVCASAANPRVEWMMRSHDVAYSIEEEEEVKKSLLDAESEVEETEKVLLFLTVYEGLEFCENLMIQKLSNKSATRSPSFVRLDELIGPGAEGVVPKETLSHIFAHVLGLTGSEISKLSCLDDRAFHDEVTYNEGKAVFRRDTNADAFFVVLKGAVALVREDYIKAHAPSKIVSGAGEVKMSLSPKGKIKKAKEIGDIRAILQVGTLFGYVDFLLERPRTFGVMATQDGTVLAKVTHARLDQLERSNPEVHQIFQSVLLQSSVMELANCTCAE